MDGENNGSKPNEQMDDLGGSYHRKPLIFGSTPIFQKVKWMEAPLEVTF